MTRECSALTSETRGGAGHDTAGPTVWAPQIARMDDRLHIHYGPIDLILSSDPDTREAVFESAINQFDGVLEALVEELPLLRTADGPEPVGPVARRMFKAVSAWRDGLDGAGRPTPASRGHGQKWSSGPWSHYRSCRDEASAWSGATCHSRSQGRNGVGRGKDTTFITPMAAVAGAVADHVLEAMRQAGATRAAVNNGGDIALHLNPGARMSVAIAGLDGSAPGLIELTYEGGVGGVATSGLGGRSLSRGIATSVTALAGCAADADVAATMIANAVDLPGHPAIRRRAATEVDPSSDLGGLDVVVDVGRLSDREVSVALDRGEAMARQAHRAGLILGACLTLADEVRVLGAARRG